MADLVVHPSVVVGPEDIITADLLNLLATPVVDLALEEPVNDQNFLRNGNFYSSFWTTPTGMTCPPNVETSNANYWYTKPQGAAVTTKRSTLVPDNNSLFSHEVDGAVGVTSVEFGQNISGDLSATMRRICTFSGNIYNNSGLVLSPNLEIYTADAFNNFATKTLRTTVNLQTCSNGVWTFVSVTLDLTNITNVANGISIVILYPSGTLNAGGKTVNHSRLKFQIGEVATEFTDDVSLFVQTPSIGAAQLQDGCIARPTLFLPNVVPAGAYQAGSITSGDIADGTIQAVDIAAGAISGSLGYVPVNKAGDSTLGTKALTTTGNTNSSVNITGIPSTSGMAPGMQIYGTGIPAGATIASIVSSSAITISAAATSTVTGLAITVFTQTGGTFGYQNDTVVGSGAAAQAALLISSSVGKASNNGYFPAIAFNRSGVYAETLGLDTSGKLKMVDHTGFVRFMLDSGHGVDTNSYQDASITYQKLAQACINTLAPCGMVVPYAGPSPPANWLICDGHLVSRTTYSALFAAIGVYWGVGDGSTTFALPDLRGRAPIGYCNTGPPSGITARGFGSYFGEESTQLAIGNMPAHAHAITDKAHSHNLSNDPHSHSYVNPIGGLGAQPGSGQYSASGATNTGSTSINMYMDAQYTGINTTQNNGSNTPHNTMQPIAVCYYIIKAV